MSISIDFQSFRPAILNIPTVSTRLNWTDYMGTFRVRWGIGRDNYKVTPGLYKIGNPDNQSDVFVSANYKLSFDVLRKNLDSLNAWILVIDTKGVNVWCAAGKKIFETHNLVRSIKNANLDRIVNHRKIIVPQLGATGVAAHKVKELSGFRVIFGPVQAKDIKAFIEAGYKATPSMRRIEFPLQDRAKLIPNDLMYEKYKLLALLVTLFVLSGLDKTGFVVSKMMETGFLPVINTGGAYIAGIVIAPLLLPLVPFRAFALKGAFWGLVLTAVLYKISDVPLIETVAFGFLNLAIASFMTMNFTGSSTYTSLSGVKKEMKWALPIQIAFAIIGLVLFIISKLI